LAKEEEEEEEKQKKEKFEENNYSREYYYKFDDPLIKEYGFVKITNTILTLRFPMTPNQTSIFTPMRHIQLYLNNRLIFNSNWLPILSTQDLLKVKTMFYQIWQEYMNLTNYKYHPPLWHSFFTPCLQYYYDPHHYSLTCSQNENATSIELFTYNSNAPSPSQFSSPVHIRVYLGPHLLLDSETQLNIFNTDAFQFVLSFILNKLVN